MLSIGSEKWFAFSCRLDSPLCNYVFRYLLQETHFPLVLKFATLAQEWKTFVLEPLPRRQSSEQNTIFAVVHVGNSEQACPIAHSRR